MTRPNTRARWIAPKAWRGNDADVLLRDNQARAVMAALQAMEGRGHGLLRKRRGLILADDVGMGKTRQGIAAATLYLYRHHGSALFLVPPALRDKWISEIREFAHAALAKKPPAKLAAVLRRLDRKADVWVMPTTRFVKRTASRATRIVVLDEAHKVRNARTALSQKLQKFIQRSNARLLLLTATPFQCDHKRELIHLLSFVDTGYVPNGAGADYVKGRGFPSIANAIEWGLNRIEQRLGEVERNVVSGGEFNFTDLLDELDINLDREHDSAAKTFAVAPGHDGFDEYLRALVVRTTKLRVESQIHDVNFDQDETAVYLLGRAYIKASRRAASKGEPFGGDPPPGGGFLPNGYSRLCSLYGAQVKRRATPRRAHPHVGLLGLLERHERRSPMTHSHPKLQKLTKVLERPLEESKKVVIFVNHTATLHQLRDVLQRFPQVRRLDARQRLRDKPRAKDLKAARQILDQSRDWQGARTALKQSGFESDEINGLETHIQRHLALTRNAYRQRVLTYISIFVVEESSSRHSDGRRSEVRSLRGTIRGQLERAERRSSASLAKTMRLRAYRPVEYLDGSLKMHQRLHLLRAFNAPDVSPFILIVSQAGSEGQNMHRACRQVIHYDLHWNPTVLHQRTGRVYRDNVAAHTVNVHVLKCVSGYDSTITDYASMREAYRDFLLGERALGDFLRATANSKHTSGWKMDLSPDPIY